MQRQWHEAKCLFTSVGNWASFGISGHLWPNKISTGKDSAREQLGGQKNYSKVKSFVTILLSQAAANEVLGDSLLHVDSHEGSNVLDIENILSKSRNVKVYRGWKNIWSECRKGGHCTSAHWNSHQFWQWERCCWVMKMIKNTKKQGLLAGDETDWSWRPSKHGLDWYGGLLLLCGNRLVLMNDRPTWSPKITYNSTYNIQHSYKYTNQIDWSYKWMTEHL